MMLRNYVMPPLPVAPSSCEGGGPILLRNCLGSGPMMLRTGIKRRFRHWALPIDADSSKIEDSTPEPPFRVVTGRMTESA
jgi:hypothetical protein